MTAHKRSTIRCRGKTRLTKIIKRNRTVEDGWTMPFGRTRREWFMSYMARENGVRINCEGGLARDDNDIQNLFKRGLIRFERRQIGILQGYFGDFRRFRNALPRRRTFAVLTAKGKEYQAKLARQNEGAK